MPVAYSDIIIIFNPNSTGPSRKMAEQLAGGLKKFKPELIPTKHAGHGEEIALSAAKKYERPLIVSVSGDGGYHEVINGVISANNPQAVAAVLPAGNANDHGSEVQDQPLIKSIREESVRKMDVLSLSVAGEVRHAHSYIGVGITPVVAVELNRTSLTAFKEAWLVVKAFHNYKPFKIDRDGRTVELDSLVFSNISRMAKVLTIGDEVKPDDGTMRVVLMPHGHKIRFLWKTLKAVFGRVEDQKLKQFTFTPRQDMPIQMDGEIKELKADVPVTIKIKPQALKTIF